MEGQERLKVLEDRLRSIREYLRENRIDAYIVPTSDPHQSEYVPDHWKMRQWLSDFDGSAGTLVITQTHAGLWTDARYFIQAAQQLQFSPFELHKAPKRIWQAILEWLENNLRPNSRVGIDGTLFSVYAVNALKKKLAHKEIVIATDVDFISAVWKNRPPLPATPVFVHPLTFAGVTRMDKITKVRQEMATAEVDFYLCTALDDIAWLVNLRGNDIEFNPVFLAYLLIGKEQVVLFVNAEKVPADIRASLANDGIELREYLSFFNFLNYEILPSAKVWLHKQATNYSIASTISPERIFWGDNIIANAKAIKNESEITGTRAAMRKDGVALIKLFRWLETALQEETVTEFEVSQKLIHFRSLQSDYFGESFAAIVGYGANGAIVHYRPHPQKSTAIRKEGLLLIDSGGQYLHGTTDITRTVALGTPTRRQQEHFTWVLKGHIAIATAKFPIRTKGVQLDILARNALWQQGLNFSHGTGHGVGSFLNVHEGPNGISPASGSKNAIFQPGMITSNEPGFYLEGAYGIRIENLILCKEEAETPFGKFLAFETLSLFPIDTSLIAEDLLSPMEVDWLNDYHQKVFALLTPFLNEQEINWLAEKCKTI